MAEAVLQPLLLTPRKRNHDGEIISQLSPNLIANSTSTNETTPASRHASPAPSSNSSLTELSSIVDPNAATSAVNSSAQPAKKRKLTFIEKAAEKAATKRAKEEKAREDAERKAQRKEEQKRRAEEKEENRRLKDLARAEEQARRQKEKDAENEAKEAKKQKREADKHEKDAEKAREAAEKAKKERSQMKLGAFFVAKAATVSTPPSSADDNSEAASSRRSSIASLNLDTHCTDVKTPQKLQNLDFNKWILPFFVPEHTEVAPVSRYKCTANAKFELDSEDTAEVELLNHHFRLARKRDRKIMPVKSLFEKMQHNEDEANAVDAEVLNLLDSIPYKYLRFREDVRPPYQGTFTRTISPRTSKTVSRNPFSRSLPNVNYDYDSEAEWEPPADDDEDLNDEDEVSEADENEEEMADFLDDADDIGRRKGPMSDMAPISTGLCWSDQDNGVTDQQIRQYRMDVLHDSTTFPIDPFSTKHWTDELKPKASPLKAKAENTSNTMQPPRLPLASLTPNTICSLMKQDTSDKDIIVTKQKGKFANSDKPTKMIDNEYLTSFKQAIDGSDLTKAGLIEILKKQFPKCSKDAIKDTLGAVAIRVGKKEADKKWQLIV